MNNWRRAASLCAQQGGRKKHGEHSDPNSSRQVVDFYSLFGHFNKEMALESSKRFLLSEICIQKHTKRRSEGTRALGKFNFSEKTELACWLAGWMDGPSAVARSKPRRATA